MTKGMILAAGQGTRVRPLTKDLPKPMIPILGKPVMEYLVGHMARHGVRQIMVNVAYHHRKIEEYFGDGSRWGVEIGYSYEGTLDHGDILPCPLGSAGGMRRIQDFSGFFDETTLVVCGDALIDLDISAAVAEHRRQGAMATVLAQTVPAQEAPNYGMVVSDPMGRVLAFQEKPRPEDALSNLASTGIYLFEPPVLDLVPRHTRYDIGSQLFPLLVAQGLPFLVQTTPFHWIDIGRVSDYWSVLQRVLRGEVVNMPMPGREIRPGIWAGISVQVAWDQVHLEGPVYIGSGVCIEPGARIIGPTWIGHGCHIRKNAVVARSVLFEYTRIGESMMFQEVVMSPHYCVNRHGETTYRGDDTSALRWSDARA
ncbi:MAG: NDP-sugar synthase [Rhodoferax sp.]